MSAPTASADAHDSPTLALTRELMQRPSVTPVDGGCQALMAERLTAIGFTCEHLRFGDVDNLWARRGTASPLLAFAGHTDVVPTGPEAEWRFDPFTPTVVDGRLYGRGAADMKGSLAAMIVALERLHAQGVTLNGSVALLITSDEEGPAHDGTVRVMEHLKNQGTSIDYCIVGEPSSTSAVGDVVRNGRRGSLNGTLTVTGIQGHVAYPEQVNNPIHGLGAAIAALSAEVWDKGNEFFPPTSFQISNLHAGTGATNVVPGHADVLLNFRFSTAVTPIELQQRTEAILEQHLHPRGLQFNVDWQLSGSPFLTDSGDLLAATAKVIESRTNLRTQFSTSGGTSDGRFIAPTGTELIELGPGNATIHQVNECVMVEELEILTDLYAGIVTELLG